MDSKLIGKAGTVAVLSTAASFGHPIYLHQLPDTDESPNAVSVGELPPMRYANAHHPASIDLVHVAQAFRQGVTPVQVAYVSPIPLQPFSARQSSVPQTVDVEDEYDFGDPAPVAVPKAWFDAMRGIQVIQPNADILAGEEPTG